MTSNENFETVNYRLTCIEDTLKELKDIFAMVIKQDSKIELLTQKVDACQERINEHTKTAGEKLEGYSARLRAVEEQPFKDSAGKWRYIVDYIFKGLVAFAIGAVIYMIQTKGV